MPLAPPTVADVVRVLDAAYAPELAEPWDRVGLVTGDRSTPVRSILLAVDSTAAVVDEARERDVDLLVTHHPLLLRGVHSVENATPKGRIVSQLVRHEVALFVAHTNADLAPGGTADCLARALGLTDPTPLVPRPWPALDKIVTFVPDPHVTAVLDALAGAGAGAVGRYDRCAFLTAGTGTFRPLPGAQPYLGQVGAVEKVGETRVEMVLDRSRRASVVRALLASHPYETPAFDIVELAGLAGKTAHGLGRMGTLAAAESLRDFAGRVARTLPATGAGIRVSGNLDAPVQQVAVQAGAGDDLLDQARTAGADVYLTSDLRHHPAIEAREWDGAPALVDVPHWAAEWLWLPALRDLLVGDLGDGVAVHVSTRCTDAWDALVR